VERLAELDLVDLIVREAEFLELLDQLLARFGFVDGEDEAGAEVDVGLLEVGVLALVDLAGALDPGLFEHPRGTMDRHVLWHFSTRLRWQRDEYRYSRRLRSTFDLPGTGNAQTVVIRKRSASSRY